MCPDVDDAITYELNRGIVDKLDETKTGGNRLWTKSGNIDELSVGF